MIDRSINLNETYHFSQFDINDFHWILWISKFHDVAKDLRISISHLKFIHLLDWDNILQIV